jgi:hypothetical protein
MFFYNKKRQNMLEQDFYAELNLNKNQLSLIIQMVADSIKNHPEQFTGDIIVQAIGMKGIGMNAPGVVGIANGGAAGSQAIGIYATAAMDNVQIEFVMKQANNELSQQMQELSRQLTELAGLVKNGSDKGKMEKILTTIKAWKWIPEIIVKVVNLIHGLS